MTDTSDLVDQGLARLGELALPKGGFGYHPGGQAFVEPTALALLALAPRDGSAREAPQQSLASSTLEVLSSWQSEKGFFGSFPGDPDPSWATSPALLALVAHRGPRLDDAGRWLMGWTAPETPFSQAQLEGFARVLKIDAKLPGWPWAAGEAFPTVEPTALGAIALHSWNSKGAGARIATTLEYLADRECRGGGWNYGNPLFFDSVQKPITLPTAKALLAVAICGSPRTRPLALRAAQRLSALLEDNPSRKAHAWGALAFAALADRERAARHAETAVDPGDGHGRFGGGADTVALTILALRAARGERISGLAPTTT